MNTNKQTNPTIIATNIPNWLESNYKRMYSYFIITPEGLKYYVENGIRISEKEFDSLYPINNLEIA